MEPGTRSYHPLITSVTTTRSKTRCQCSVALLQPIPKSSNPPGAHLEANKGDLHGEDGSQAVDCAVGHVDPVGEAPCEHQHQDVQGDEVDQEDVATPRGDLPGHKPDTHTHKLQD